MHFAFDSTGGSIGMEDVERAFNVLLKEESPAVEGVLLGPAPRQIALLKALGGCPRIENLLRKRCKRAKHCVSSR